MRRDIVPGATQLVQYVVKNNAQFSTLNQAMEALRPSKPLYAVFPKVIEKMARGFVSVFPGKTLYAVKTNPDLVALRAVSDGGVQAFDVASIEEIARVKSFLPDAHLYFMHPVKAPEDIRSAYFDFHVCDFVVDCVDELYKILRETDLAQDLNLFIRLALPKNDSAMIDFSSKFGAAKTEALELLQQCRPVAGKLGVSFHVGTQNSDAACYAHAIEYVAALLDESDVSIDVLNVGGGYPVPYADGQEICMLDSCIDVIQDALDLHGLNALEILAEPGRYLVAQGAKLIARVELRKGDILFINDGIYGGLFDASDWLGVQYPVQAYSCDRPFDGDMAQFRLAGPTCDSLDMMNGPFVLPSDVGMGDWIVFENCGAYSSVLRSNFNGFGHADMVLIG